MGQRLLDWAGASVGVVAARILAALLAIFGVLKLWPGAAILSPARGEHWPPSLIFVAAAMEIGMGILLALRPRSARVISTALAVIMLFACFHLFSMLFGDPTSPCGCLGPVLRASHRAMTFICSGMLALGIVALARSRHFARRCAHLEAGNEPRSYSAP